MLGESLQGASSPFVYAYAKPYLPCPAMHVLCHKRAVDMMSVQITMVKHTGHLSTDCLAPNYNGKIPTESCVHLNV